MNQNQSKPRAKRRTYGTEYPLLSDSVPENMVGRIVCVNAGKARSEDYPRETQRSPTRIRSMPIIFGRVPFSLRIRTPAKNPTGRLIWRNA